MQYIMGALMAAAMIVGVLTITLLLFVGVIIDIVHELYKLLTQDTE